MYYAIIDCGTTNSRVYIVDENSYVYGVAKKTVGVRDTATTSSRDILRQGLRQLIDDACQKANIKPSDLDAVLSSGMITSEIGLHEIPHLMAPGGKVELAESITKVENTQLVPEHVPVYFVRGIKNKMDKGVLPPSEQVGQLDFMRGEETQVIGMLQKNIVETPIVVVILSSHTKFIAVCDNGLIQGSLTTMSGQVYDAVTNHTFVGKSVEERESGQPKPDGYFDTKIVSDAISWVEKAGLVRSLMFPRFMDVLLDSTWYERALFYESIIASDDMQCINSMKDFIGFTPENFILVGRKERCKIYEYVIKNTIKQAKISMLDDEQSIDMLSILGALQIAKKAGVI